jgi:hypothetical protein
MFPLKNIGKILVFGIFGLAGGAGLIWILNLPYPMIRRPVARTAPIILLPSYISMDRNYREAITNVEQSDQLVNKATSREDIELGKEKVEIAQKNLDKLPVWFLGYEPKMYCSLFGCTWKFTIDEFEVARKQIGRSEAVIFQEINALNQLEKSEKLITEAKQNYQNATDSLDRQSALSNWQTAIDELEQLPPKTLAGRIGKTKLLAYQRDFQQVSGLIAGGQRTNTRIDAAKEFAISASKLCKNPPYLNTTWQQCENLWQKSITYLKFVPLTDKGYLEAQKLLANYETNLATILIKKQVETQSAQYLLQAESRIEQLLASDQNNRNSVISQLQGIINQLEKIQIGTTSYNKSQQLLKSAQNKLQQFQ